MIGITLHQPVASAVVYGVELGASWPSEWAMRPDAIGRFVAVHAGVAWSAEHAARAAQLGVTDCPRGQIVGMARVAGWSRVQDGKPSWLGVEGGPAWAKVDGRPDRRALLERWPLGAKGGVVFFDEAAPLTASALGVPDDAELICSGDARGPWTVPDDMVQRLRRRWGAPASASAGRPSSTRPAPRPPRPPTPDAQRTADRLASLMPPEWSLRVDGFTVGIVDPLGKCRRALLGQYSRAELADILVRLVGRYGVGSTDAAVAFVRSQCPYSDPKRAA